MPSGNPCARPVACSSLMKTRSPGATVPRSLQRSRASTFPGWTHRCSAWPRPTRSSATRPRWKTSSCRRWRIWRRRCASCMRSSAARVYALLFFLSGATGLVYELLWVRLLYQAFGSTIQSVTTVVAAYMGGLGLGAWLLGRRVDRDPRPAALYGRLEIAIGLFGLVSPLVLALVHRGYVAAAGAWHLSGEASVALRFGLAALVLLIPTTLMGGTLPVLTRALMGEDRDLLKPSLGRLYGLNTLGAVTGTALAGFLLIEFVGVRASLWTTAALNLAIGAAAIRLGRQQDALEVGHTPAEENLHEPPPTSNALHNLALALLALTAFASLLNEIAWTRVLIMIVGGSTYAFTLILLVFLLGIGLGSIIVARRSAPRAETAASAALAQGVTGVAALALAGLAARGVAEHSAEDRRLRVRVLSAAGLGTLALVAAAAAPGWSTRLIDLGPTIYARQRMDGPARERFLTHRGVRQLAFREGANATVSVWEGESGRSLRVNGKVDGSDRGDMDTQVMLGLAPAVARVGAASALVIGYGTGVTAHVLAEVPSVRRLKVVEIEPSVVQMDSFFLDVNGSVLSRPDVRVVIDDARSAFQLDRERYDVIVSEPSNPWVAGIATLYTPEFFRIAKTRLADDGVFCQWIQLYQLPLPIVAGIVRSLRQVFPHVHVWFGGTADLVVLASPRPITYDRQWLGQLLGPGGQLYTLGREWLSLESQDQYFGRMLLGDSGVTRLLGRATFNHTDDQPRLEFVAARRFLDPGAAAYAVFDSLVQLGEGDAGTSPFALLRILATRRGDAGVLPYLHAAHRAQPDVFQWSVRAAGIRLALGDTAQADSLLKAVIARNGSADALQMRALLAAARTQPLAATPLPEAAAPGPDTAHARAALALLAVRGSRWDEAASQARHAPVPC